MYLIGVRISEASELKIEYISYPYKEIGVLENIKSKINKEIDKLKYSKAKRINFEIVAEEAGVYNTIVIFLKSCY